MQKEKFLLHVSMFKKKKIASIGLKIKKGHCYHGISFNVDMDLKPFEGIATCGFDSLEVTQLKDLSPVSIKTIKHCFFNKSGGKSKKIYKSLNCGPGSKDNLSNVKKNLQIVKKKIKSTAKNIFLLHQIHSNKFVYINKKITFKSKPKADAVITNQIPYAFL